MIRKTGHAFKILGSICVLLSLVLAYCNVLDEDYAADISEELIIQVQRIILNTQSAYSSDVEAPGRDFVLNPEMEMPAVEIGGYVVIGEINIPSQQIVLPVLSEWNDAAAKAAPCRYKGSVYTNDIIVAGHNYRSHFRQLIKVGIGDEVWFTDMAGNEFLYRVCEIESIAETDLAGMEAGDWDLTLFTCTYGGKARLTIRCERSA